MFFGWFFVFVLVLFGGGMMCGIWKKFFLWCGVFWSVLLMDSGVCLRFLCSG